MPFTRREGLCLPPHAVPSWAAQGMRELCRGWGGVRGGGLQPFGVSFVPSLCSCAWICAWSQDIWVLSEQLTLASNASPCLSFPPASTGRVEPPLGFASGPQGWSQPWSWESRAITQHVPRNGEGACHHLALASCHHPALARPASTWGGMEHPGPFAISRYFTEMLIWGHRNRGRTHSRQIS